MEHVLGFDILSYVFPHLAENSADLTAAMLVCHEWYDAASFDSTLSVHISSLFLAAHLQSRRGAWSGPAHYVRDTLIFQGFAAHNFRAVQMNFSCLPAENLI